MDTLISSLSSVKAERTLEDVEDASEYELDQPENTITVTMEDGSETVIRVGMENDSTSQEYIDLDKDSSTVYVVSNSTFQSFEGTLYDFAESGTFPTVDSSTISKVSVDGKDFSYSIEKDENNPQYYDKVKKFFSNGYEADKKFVTSVITMEEYFVFPYRNKLYSFIDMFDRLVETTDMEIVEVNQEIAKKAAQIRAEYKFFKPMDALQLATACITGCDLFLTNDKQLRQFREIKCVIVDELE